MVKLSDVDLGPQNRRAWLPIGCNEVLSVQRWDTQQQLLDSSCIYLNLVAGIFQGTSHTSIVRQFLRIGQLQITSDFI